MGNTKKHLVLTFGADFDAAQKHTVSFFQKTMLLRYDNVTISKEKSCQATEASFWKRLDDGVAANREILSGFISELHDSGLQDLRNLHELQQGYQSKVFHIVAHLLDGFIGIDSVFYSLPEDSHWLSEKLRAEILRSPEKYWLLSVTAQFSSAESASLVHL